jgi:ssDNA-binding Zn-finger/Zn-ribbon topoisomerase 1
MADVRCPKCGNKTTIRTAKKDEGQYHVCINYPGCRGRVLVDEDRNDDWGDDWDKARPAAKPAYDKPRQRVKPSSPERGAEKTVHTAKKDERKVRAGADHPERKGKVPIDKTWGDDWEDDWGDDWDKEIPAPKPAPDRARRHVAPKPEIAPEKKESPRPRTQTVHKEEEHPEPQQQIVPQKEVAPEKKEPTKPRPRRVPQRYLAPEKKKRSMTVIVIAIIIAFLAIDGMIYAAFVLR